MPNVLRLSGFAELRAELDALPTGARNDAARTLAIAAERSRVAIVTSYPIVTGELRRGVRVIQRAARGIAALYTLVSSAPYAHIVEFGSARTRPLPIFRPISDRDRRAAVVAIADQVTARGLVVRGARD